MVLFLVAIINDERQDTSPAGVNILAIVLASYAIVSVGRPAPTLTVGAGERRLPARERSVERHRIPLCCQVLVGVVLASTASMAPSVHSHGSRFSLRLDAATGATAISRIAGGGAAIAARDFPSSSPSIFGRTSGRASMSAPAASRAVPTWRALVRASSMDPRPTRNASDAEPEHDRLPAAYFAPRYAKVSRSRNISFASSHVAEVTVRTNSVIAVRTCASCPMKKWPPASTASSFAPGTWAAARARATVGRERIVSGADDQRRHVQLLERKTIRGRFLDTNPSKTAPSRRA